MSIKAHIVAVMDGLSQANLELLSRIIDELLYRQLINTRKEAIDIVNRCLQSTKSNKGFDGESQ